MNKQPAVRIARWSATHPWRAVVLWLVFVAVCVGVGSVVTTVKATDVDLSVGESSTAAAIREAGKFDDHPQENVLITAKAGQLDQRHAMAVAGEASARMHALPEVLSVGDPAPAPDGKAVTLPLTMRGPPEDGDAHVQPLLDATAAVQAAHPDLRVEQVGDASLDKGIGDQLGNDFEHAEILSLPVTLIILLVAFGAITAAGVPVLLALSAVGSSIGLAALASHVFPDSGSTSQVILLMGMAVGVDYSLFYLKREREERAKGASHVRAVEIAAATSGHAVVVSAFAVIVSMAGLYLADDAIFNSLGTGSIIVVAVAMMGSLTVLPALLAKLGKRVDRPRVPLLWRLTNRGGEPRLWPALLKPALKHPAITLVVSVGALLALALPVLDIKLASSDITTLPREIPAVQAYDRLTAAFPSEGTTNVIMVQAGAGQAGAVDAQVGALAKRVAADPLFAHDQKPRVTVSADKTVHMIKVGIPFEPNTEQAKQSVERLRGDIVPATLGHVPGARTAVSGEVAGNIDYTQHVKDKLPWVVGFVLLLTLLMMAYAFRSLVIALSAIVLNMLSAGAAFGVMSAVFQHSWAEGLLDFHSTGAIVSWMPLFVFTMLFGLSMDYHVFVVSRIREAAMRGMPTREAVRAGITRSAGVVTSAAVVMISVFAIFATLSMIEMKQLGVGLGVAVLIDAMIVRVLVLPSLMSLLGKANWWPSRGVRRASTQVVPDSAAATQPLAKIGG
ncbi:MMPL family transporter [Labedaea rhizosphaerae]|uniref:RND superfamily putative drug exporter n=1 Tax=Labedaea rhizosphaerae TaxID=598644 RepID=A0A4V3CZB9_LABRH|nr:MMPL family transporter [Labedaea rhizosphaerae]TDP97448.1 RND superfamily putative drug exporter [Labedaea rhizosphaerae]